jgi:hypothetical protein
VVKQANDSLNWVVVTIALRQDFCAFRFGAPYGSVRNNDVQRRPAIVEHAAAAAHDGAERARPVQLFRRLLIAAPTPSTARATRSMNAATLLGARA